MEEVLKSLKQFLEQATLGDFLVRLDMLLAFHCHLVTVETGDGTQQRLARGLWNLHQFYSRFLATVQKELDSLRTPIEKELKVGAGFNPNRIVFKLNFPFVDIKDLS